MNHPVFPLILSHQLPFSFGLMTTPFFQWLKSKILSNLYSSCFLPCTSSPSIHPADYTFKTARIQPLSGPNPIQNIVLQYLNYFRNNRGQQFPSQSPASYPLLTHSLFYMQQPEQSFIKTQSNDVAFSWLLKIKRENFLGKGTGERLRRKEVSSFKKQKSQCF